MVGGISLVVASVESKYRSSISPYCRTSQIMGKKFSIYHLLSTALSSAIGFAISLAVYTVMKRSQVSINPAVKLNFSVLC